MRHPILLIFIVSLITLNKRNAFAQCNPPILMCNDISWSYTPTHPADVWISCVVPIGYTGPIIKFTSASFSFSVKAYGRNIIGDPCDFLVGAACDSFSLTTSLTINILHGSGVGEYYYFRITPSSYSASVSAFYLVYPNPCYADTTDLPCSDCIPSFNPQPDSSYIVSGWIRDANASANTTTFLYGSISISYPPGSHVSGPFHPQGQIIDGWQRLEDTFRVPKSAEQIRINLNAGTTSFFDDIRVFPYKGSMKSYVFDPLTLRLVAELDERNYATIYEYDEEGKLVRVKKETERGIMTIQENRSNTSK